MGDKTIFLTTAKSMVFFAYSMHSIPSTMEREILRTSRAGWDDSRPSSMVVLHTRKLLHLRIRLINPLDLVRLGGGGMINRYTISGFLEGDNPLLMSLIY